MNWSKVIADHKHPIWSLARLTIAMTALFCILYFTASHFDQTEHRTLVSMFLVLAGGEGVTSLLGRLMGK